MPGETVQAVHKVLDDPADEHVRFEKPPRTLTVLGVLISAAGILSYLVAYAVTNALASAEMIRRWPPDQDPRPRWLAICFISLLATFGLLGMLARWNSKRHLRRIEEMEKEDEPAGS